MDVEQLESSVLNFLKDMKIPPEELQSEIISGITMFIIDELSITMPHKMDDRLLPLLRDWIICEYFLLLEIKPTATKEVKEISLGDGKIVYDPTKETHFFAHIEAVRNNIRSKIIAHKREVTW